MKHCNNQYPHCIHKAGGEESTKAGGEVFKA